MTYDLTHRSLLSCGVCHIGSKGGKQHKLHYCRAPTEATQVSSVIGFTPKQAASLNLHALTSMQQHPTHTQLEINP